MFTRLDFLVWMLCAPLVNAVCSWASRHPEALAPKYSDDVKGISALVWLAVYYNIGIILW